MFDDDDAMTAGDSPETGDCESKANGGRLFVEGELAGWLDVTKG